MRGVSAFNGGCLSELGVGTASSRFASSIAPTAMDDWERRRAELE
jgi:hypothetical protein